MGRSRKLVGVAGAAMTAVLVTASAVAAQGPTVDQDSQSSVRQHASVFATGDANATTSDSRSTGPVSRGDQRLRQVRPVTQDADTDQDATTDNNASQDNQVQASGDVSSAASGGSAGAAGHTVTGTNFARQLGGDNSSATTQAAAGTQDSQQARSTSGDVASRSGDATATNDTRATTGGQTQLQRHRSVQNAFTLGISPF